MRTKHKMTNEAAAAVLKCMLIDIRQNLSDSLVKNSPMADVLTQREEAIETALKAIGTLNALEQAQLVVNLDNIPERDIERYKKEMRIGLSTDRAALLIQRME